MKKSTILLIDEDIQYLEVVSRRLRKLGYQVKPARSADEARRLASQSNPCMILVDRGLPGDGEASRRILKSLRGDPAVSMIPVLLTSARQFFCS